MLNIKDTGFGTPKTAKSILNYDNHFYKEKNLILDKNENVVLIDNSEQFFSDIKQYKNDLTALYKSERHLKLKKTNKQILEQFNSSKVMRTFRIAINHIELETLHKTSDSLEKRKENIVNFYNDCLEQLRDVFKKNSINNECKIIKADIHFDQANPHIHIHISNLYQKYFKKINKEAFTCNCNISDLISILMKQKIKMNNKFKLNEIFANELMKKNENYNLINFLDLKKAYPEIYDIYTYKKLNNISTKFKEDDAYYLQWRRDKEIQFLMSQNYLKKMNLKIDDNHILNQRKINDLVLYTFLQSLKVQKVLNPTPEELELINERVANKWDDKQKLEQIIKERNTEVIVQPKDLIWWDTDMLEHKLSNEFKNLKSIEDELNLKLKLDLKFENNYKLHSNDIVKINIDNFKKDQKNTNIEKSKTYNQNDNFYKDYYFDNLINKNNDNKIQIEEHKIDNCLLSKNKILNNIQNNIKNNIDAKIQNISNYNNDINNFLSYYNENLTIKNENESFNKKYIPLFNEEEIQIQNFKKIKNVNDEKKQRIKKELKRSFY